jgi:hypothetical protein
MGFGSVALVPGVNVLSTPTLLRAGISSASMVRFKGGLVQKLGGYKQFYPYPIKGTPRDLHAWEDLNTNTHLGIGTTEQLAVITNNSLKDITPQTLISNFAPSFSTTAGSAVVTITDPNIANVTTFDSVFFNVPVSIGGIILDGLYPITNITGTDSYQITAINFITGAPAPAISTSGVPSLPIFTTTIGSEIVSVNFVAHGQSVGSTVVFPITTTGNGVTIDAAYDVVSVTDANDFTIATTTQATASGAFPMNGGNAQLVYSIALGPASAAGGGGYGAGGYGEGGYGTGSGSISGAPQTGTEITATDWTEDNWGNILVACPKGGGIFYWDPTGGFQNAQIISSGPPFNNGIFISMSEQILIAYGSSVKQGIGFQQQLLLVEWCDVSNFFNWVASAQTQAGNFTIPSGSAIMGGMSAPNQNLIWTDLDLWAMTYIGPPDVFGFNKIGVGMGMISSHAMQNLSGSVYWMGRNNFYSYTSGGVAPIPCPVWDSVFQNINTNYLQNVRTMPNTPFNEVGWLFPSAASVSGECDTYVKMNVVEPGQPWDYGPWPRSAWIDQSVLGMPIGASPNGIIYQHETTPDAAGAPLVSSFLTGFFYLAEGEEFVFVDQVLPDFKWETFAGGSNSAQIQMTFYVVNYPGDTPIAYGPYTCTQQTEYLSVRFRGRLMAIGVQTSDIGSFYRLGSCKWRYAPAGRR